jgi:hypothetical protein
MTLRDLSWTIGALAVGLEIDQMVIRAIFPGWIHDGRWPSWIRDRSPASQVSGMLSDAAAPLVPVAASGTLLALLLHWLKNRNHGRSRYWFRMPGTVAGTDALVGWGWALLGLAMTQGFARSLLSQHQPALA